MSKMECTVEGCTRTIDIDGAEFAASEAGNPIEDGEWFFDIVRMDPDTLSIERFVLYCPKCAPDNVTKREHNAE